MKNSITVKQALKKGKIQLVILPMCILLSSIFLTSYLAAAQICEPWVVAVGIFGGFILAFLYWSANVSKWKIWAFDSVRNVNELKRKAIMNRLIWEDGSFFEKMAFQTHDQKQSWHQLNKKFLEKDVYHDDLSVPKEAAIGYSKLGMVFGLIFSIGIASFSLYFGLWKQQYFALLGLLLAGFFFFSELKKLKSDYTPIVLNANGIALSGGKIIPWNNIQDEYVILRQEGKYAKYFLTFLEIGKMQHEISITELNTNAEKLENLLQVYRVRFEKNHA